MKKLIYTILIMLPLFSLNSCNRLIVGDDPLANITAGEVPEGGEKISYDESQRLLDFKYSNLKKSDSLTIDISNSKIYSSNYEFIKDEQTNQETLINEFLIDNFNGQFSIDGMINATTLTDLKYKVNSSGDFLYIDEYNTRYEADNFYLNSYLNNNVIYNDISDNLLTLLNIDLPTKSYIEVDDSMSLVLSKLFEVTLPISSIDNYLHLKDFIIDFLPNELLDYEEFDFSKVFYDNFYTLNKYDNKYLFNININKDNINSVVSDVLDDLYEAKFFDLYYDINVTPAQYNDIKNNFTKTLNESLIKGFSHFKMSMTFTLGSIEEILIDYDYITQNPVVEYSVPKFTKSINQGKININFEYGKGISFNEFDSSDYTLYEVNYYSNDFINLIGYCHQNGNPFNIEEIEIILNEPFLEMIIHGTGLYYYSKEGYTSMEEIEEAIKDGKTVNFIVVYFIEDKAYFGQYDSRNNNEE